MLFDTHCHLNFSAIGENWRSLAFRAKENGVEMINNIGSGVEESERALMLAKEWGKNFIATVGVHPNYVHEEIYQENPDFILGRLSELCEEEEVKAVGETGLDYYRVSDSVERSGIDEATIKKIQKDFFNRFIKFAAERDKALVMHCRDAYEDFYEVLNNSMPKGQRGVVHFYIGSTEMMRRLLDLGLYIGFTGVITYPNTEVYEQNVREVPLDRIVLETDSPFAAPVPYRGKDNEPAYLVEIAKKVAEIRGISVQEVAEATTKNAKKLFNLG